ncbi:hypothetical protein CC79DRAFT_200604 [Sarocladium strictum]
MEAVRVIQHQLRQRWDSFQYTPVGKAEYGADVKKRPAWGSLLRISLCVVGIISIIIGARSYMTSGTHILTDGSYAYDASLQDHWFNILPGTKRFVVVILANGPGTSICKVMMSAIAMGYPMPVIVNWDQQLDDYFPSYVRKTNPDHIGPELLKIVSALEYLDEVSQKTANRHERLDEDDLVLFVDSSDIWFQVPPEVLIRRYHQQNEEANNRMLQLWPGEKGDMPMHQSIIMPAQKKCDPLPGGAYDLKCDKLPDSPLRWDLYGWGTDPSPKKFDKPSADAYSKVRPKFLDNGAILGTVEDLRKYLRKSKAKMDEKTATDRRQVRSAKGMMAEIFGEQEVFRTWQRKGRESWSNPGELFIMQNEYEYGVGLDYKQQISVSTEFGEKHGDIVAMNDTKLIDEQSRERGIKTRLHGVPPDIEQATNPLSRLEQFQDKNVTAWGDLPMYADFYTASVPAMVHHNAHSENLENRQTLWWNRMWYFPYLRDLVNARLESNSTDPIVEIRARNGRKAKYFPLQADRAKRRPRIFYQGFGKVGLMGAQWDQMCMSDTGSTVHWTEEVFRDGKGALGESLLLEELEDEPNSEED